MNEIFGELGMSGWSLPRCFPDCGSLSCEGAKRLTEEHHHTIWRVDSFPGFVWATFVFYVLAEVSNNSIIANRLRQSPSMGCRF